MISQNKNSLINTFKDVCRKHDLKMTPQRFAIYEELIKSKLHPSADMIYKKVRRTFPNISFDTVNRTLLTFSKIGIIHAVEGHGAPRRFDANLEKHHHFRCMKCDNIIDFFHTSFDQIKIPYKLKKQFTVLNKKVVLEGICKKCLKK